MRMRLTIFCQNWMNPKERICLVSHSDGQFQIGKKQERQFVSTFLYISWSLFFIMGFSLLSASEFLDETGENDDFDNMDETGEPLSLD